MPNWMTWIGISFGSLLMIVEGFKAMLPDQRLPLGPIILIIFGVSIMIGGAVWLNSVIKSSKFINFWIRATTDDIPPNTIIGGIKWNEAYTDIRVALNNPTNRNYNDLEITIETDMMVAEIGQITNLPNVWFKPITAVPVGDLSIVIRDATGKVKSVTPIIPNPNTRVFTGKYVTYCPGLPRNSHIDLAIATVTINHSASQKPPEIIYEQKRLPSWVKVTVRYQDSGNEYTLEEKKDFPS